MTFQDDQEVVIFKESQHMYNNNLYMYEYVYVH